MVVSGKLYLKLTRLCHTAAAKRKGLLEAPNDTFSSLKFREGCSIEVLLECPETVRNEDCVDTLVQEMPMRTPSQYRSR